MSTISTAAAAGEARFCRCGCGQELPAGFRGYYFPDTAEACRKRFDRERKKLEQARAELEHSEQVLAEKHRRDRDHRGEDRKAMAEVLRRIGAVQRGRRGGGGDTDSIEEEIRGLWQEYREAKLGYTPTAHSKDVEIKVAPLELPRNKPQRKQTYPLKLIDASTGEVTAEYRSVGAFTRARNAA